MMNQRVTAMYKYLGILITLVSIGLMTGCGSEAYTTASTTTGDTTTTTTTTTPAPVATLILSTSSPSLGSTSSDSVTISAIIKDSNNNLMPDVDVVFSANGGALAVTSGTTSATGVATAVLTTAGDPTNRTITITATAGGVSANVQVTVSGTTVNVSGSNSLVYNDSTVLTVFLKDSDGVGLSAQTVSVSSANGNTLSAASLSTGASGQAQVTITGTVAGTDTITVSALGAVAVFSIIVSADQFVFTAPPNADMNIGTTYPVTISWSTGGVAVADGQTVNFSTTRGTLSATSATTTGGTASVNISSTNAGPAVITATVTGGPTASATREFVATTPNTITIQADKTTIGPDGKQAALTATVRDINNNLVKNKTVRFSIFDDNSGGSISNSTDVSDSQGTASTVYTSTSATTAKDGVVIRAVLDGVVCNDPTTNLLCDEIKLTVAQNELFVVLGTGNKIFIEDETRYRFPYNVVVTDAGGNAVANTTVGINLIPKYYRTGYLLWFEDLKTNVVIPSDYCENEDAKNLNSPYNGVLDAGEDINNNGVLDPRNVASVSSTVTTDANGFALIDIIYAKQFALWVSVEISATAGVSGTESSDTVFFTLPAAAEELNSKTNPPSSASPWGATSTCTKIITTAPYGLSATPSITNTGEISLYWLGPDSAIDYNVYRGTSPITDSDILTPATNPNFLIATNVSPPFLDTGLTPTTTYFYRITGNFPNGVLIVGDPINVSDNEGSPSVEASAVAPN